MWKFLVVLFLASCVQPINYAPYTTFKVIKYNIILDANNTPGVPKSIENAFDVFSSICDSKLSTGRCGDFIKGVIIQWWGVITPSPFFGTLNTVVVYNGQVYSGLTTLENMTCRVAWRGKLYRSAFAHELLHIVSYRLFGDPDGIHSNQLVWNDTESAINARLKELDM